MIDEPPHSRLGLRIREMRIERKWTMDELAERSGTSRSTVHRLENAESVVPQNSRVAKIVLALGMSEAEMWDLYPARADKVARCMARPLPQLVAVPDEPCDDVPDLVAWDADNGVRIELRLEGGDVIESQFDVRAALKSGGFEVSVPV